MRNRLIGSIVVVVAVIAFSPGMFAQAPAGPGAAKAIPDLSGIWDTRAGGGVQRTAENAICGVGCIQPNGVLPPPAPSENVEEPHMLPWAEEQYKAVRRDVTNPNAFSNQALNPSWGACLPEGPTESTRRRGFEIVQFPDVVLLLFDYDHEVRRIYMDGRGHPDHPAPTWMGHSIGKYEGDTLVIDTVGISDKAWIDVQGHPHSDALRVVERLRRLNPKTVEVEITINDPKTYSKPWTKKVVHELRPPRQSVWDQTACEEILQMGTHYSAESKK